MTEISASMVKELREKTGAGMMDCKNALSQAGNIDGAVKILREKGLARAAKKTSRVAAEGLIGIKLGSNEAAMVEINCETDFVARNDGFKSLVVDLASTALLFKANTADDACNIDGAKLNQSSFNNSGSSVESVITDKIATIGEKIALRRFAKLEGGSLYGEYVHGAGSIGVLVEFKLDKPELKDNADVKQAARDIAMHVAASNPSFISTNDIPKEWIESEREIFVKQVLAEGKPANMVDKIVDGKMAKHVKDFSLLDQPFVKNTELSIKDVLDGIKKNVGANVTISRMVRFKVGEGIDKPDAESND